MLAFWKRWRRARRRRRVDRLIREAVRIRDESYGRYKRAKKVLAKLYRAKGRLR